MKKIKLILVGYGPRGKNWLQIIKKNKKTEIIAICDINEKTKDKYTIDIPFYSKISNALLESKADGIILSTPPFNRMKDLKACAKYRLPILVEKPLSDTMEGGNELIKTQKESGLVGLVGYCFRYDPAALKFRELLNNDKTGQILHVTVDCGSYLPDWRPGENYKKSVSAKNKLGGGVLLELSLELDYIRYHRKMQSGK